MYAYVGGELLIKMPRACELTRVDSNVTCTNCSPKKYNTCIKDAHSDCTNLTVHLLDTLLARLCVVVVPTYARAAFPADLGSFPHQLPPVINTPPKPSRSMKKAEARERSNWENEHGTGKFRMLDCGTVCCVKGKQ